MTDNIINFQGVREAREFGGYIDRKRAFREALFTVISEHVRGGCDFASITFELIDMAKRTKEFMKVK